MAEEKKRIRRKIVHAGGWALITRGAKMLPFGGTFLAIGLVGHDIKRKGLVKGVVNSGINAIPVVGFAKNAVEIFTGDFISDKDRNGSKKNKK